MAHSGGELLVNPKVVRGNGLLIQHDPAAPPSILARLGDDPDSLLADGVVLKPGDRCTIARLDEGERSFVLKRFNRKDRLHTATHLLLRSRAARWWSSGRTLIARGLAVAQPLITAERRVGPLRFESYLLTKYVPGPTLLDFINAGDWQSTQLQRVAVSFGEIWSVLGSLRAAHDDMKATNFIVDDSFRLWLIDLDGMKLGMPPPLFGRARRQDLARFMRNWQDQPAVLEAFRAQIETT